MHLPALLIVLTCLLHESLHLDLRYLRAPPEDQKMVGRDVETNCSTPVWSEWTESLSCNRECGACGTRILARVCETPDCPCSGASRREDVCNIQVCDYPLPACCPPYRIESPVQGNFSCGPQNEIVATAFMRKREGDPKTSSIKKVTRRPTSPPTTKKPQIATSTTSLTTSLTSK